MHSPTSPGRSQASELGTTITNLARLHELSALGFDHAMVSPNGPWTPAAIDAVASALPEIHALAG